MARNRSQYNRAVGQPRQGGSGLRGLLGGLGVALARAAIEYLKEDQQPLPPATNLAQTASYTPPDPAQAALVAAQPALGQVQVQPATVAPPPTTNAYVNQFINEMQQQEAAMAEIDPAVARQMHIQNQQMRATMLTNMTASSHEAAKSIAQNLRS